jgi:hypothetical protein
VCRSHFARAETIGILKMAKKIKWSKCLPLDEKGIKGVPCKKGVFEIHQSKCYYRYKGKTKALNIGQSEQNIRKEIKNRRTIHTSANRLNRIMKMKGLKVTFRYVESRSPKKLETKLLKEFEDKHGELPVLNSQRGYKRGED